MLKQRPVQERWYRLGAKPFHLHEWTFRITPIGNPFSPSENDIVMELKLPGGNVKRHPAFWDGDDTWKVRFTPIRSGTIQWRLQRNSEPLNVAVQIQVSPISMFAEQGFVRRHAKWTRQFTTDSGKTFYPIGQNVGWQSPGADYPNIFVQMAQARMNWARVWMCHWDGKNPEWVMGKRVEPGRLDLEPIRRIEQIVKLAEQHGIYIQLVLQHHGQYSTTTDSNWAENPWNERNGGFLSSPIDFFTSARAINLTRQKYRYLIARWGYSPHIMAWELFNEVEWTDAFRSRRDVVARWHRDMAQFIREQDIHNHLVTTSSHMEFAELWQEMDYYQPHYYVPDITTTLMDIKPESWQKPLFIGEWGSSSPWQWGDPQALRVGLWVGTMCGHAGAAQWWAWDVTERAKLYAAWGSLTRLLKAAGFSSSKVWQPLVALVRSDARGALAFSPGGGWQSTTRFRYVIPNDGSAIEGLNNLARFVQGESHRDMTRQPIVLETDFAQDGECILRIGVVARAGAAITVKLDDREIVQERFPSADRDQALNRDIRFAIPAGKHVISIFNPGVDWFTLDRITLTPYAPPGRIAACGEGRNAIWYLWRDEPSEGKIRVSIRGMPAGQYQVVWWNPAQGQTVAKGSTTVVRGGLLEVEAPPFERDIAGMVVPPGHRVSL